MRVFTIGCLLLLPVITLAQPRETYTIFEIQHSGPELQWQSQHVGEVVNCTGGIVTHKFRQRICIQNPQFGSEWAAIEIRGYPVYPTGIEVGDFIELESVYVDEYRGATTLQYYNDSRHTVLSSGNPLPEPVPVPVWHIRYPAHPEDCERYAAMLIALNEPVTVGALGLGGHEDNYELLSDLGDIAYGSDYANGDIDSTYYVSSGECYERIVGVLQRYDDDDQWDYYQLLPRGIADYQPCSNAVPWDTGMPRVQVWLTAPAPNPARSTIAATLVLSQRAQLEVAIYQATGRHIRDLLSGELAPGRHTLSWNGRDENARNVPGGIYLLRARCGSLVQTRSICITD